MTLAAGGANAASHGMMPTRRMAIGILGGTECERGVFRAERKRERVSAKPIERHQEVAEAMSRRAGPSGGAAARTRKRAGRGHMMPLPMWNTGCLCGNGYCRLCRSKTVRSAQRRQHGMTEPSPFQGKQHFSYLKFRANFSENRLSRATQFPRAGSRAYAVCPQLRRSRLPPSDR